MNEVEIKFNELLRAINQERAFIKEGWEEVDAQKDANKELKFYYEIELRKLESEKGLVEKEKAIDRERKARLDVREGKIQAVEERLRRL